jgi:hypothetical protein
MNTNQKPDIIHISDKIVYCNNQFNPIQLSALKSNCCITSKTFDKTQNVIYFSIIIVYYLLVLRKIM